MSSFRANLAVALSAVLLASPALATRTHKSSSSASHPSTLHSSSHSAKTHSAAGRSHSGHKAAAAAHRQRGQQAIEPERVTEIQQALIREHYLDGEATGEWNQATRDALIRFQSDNRWQTKVLPDARALIKLGLGPSQQNLLNPESAVLAPPYQSGIEKASRGGSN